MPGSSISTQPNESQISEPSWHALTLWRTAPFALSAASTRVDRQLVDARGGVPEFGPSKSRAGFRTAPVPEVGRPEVIHRYVRVLLRLNTPGQCEGPGAPLALIDPALSVGRVP
jgi:hypothetical protein